jgi:N-acetylglucosamine-6-phosphate deacetylase
MDTSIRWAFRNAILCVDGEEVEGDLLVIDGRIAGVGRISAPVGTRDRDLGGMIVAPGLIDIQLNGLCGAEVYQASTQALTAMSLAAPRFGCTAFLPTMISAPEQLYRQLFRSLPERPPEGGAKLLGLHLEGPYINPEFPGAHSPEAIRLPDLSEARRLLEAANGRIRVWTLAPEMEGGPALIQLLQDHDVIVAAGHSNLSFEESVARFAEGVQLVTHLFNAMSPLHHRAPGLPGATLVDGDVMFSMIADGIHVHPTVVQLAHRTAAHRLLLITDAAPSSGPEGSYMVSGREVFYEDDTPRLADGRLAGSGLTAIRAVLNLQEYAGCTLAQAFSAMTALPAAILRTDTGRLAEGMAADFLVLDKNGELTETWIDGRVAYARTRVGVSRESVVAEI